MTITLGPDQQSVTISDDPATSALQLRLVNGGNDAVVLRGGGIVSEDAISSIDATTLYVRFGADFSPPRPDEVAVSADTGSWRVGFFDEGFPVWAFSPEAEVSLPAGKTATLTITGVGASRPPRPIQIGVDSYNLPGTEDAVTQLVLSLERPPRKKLKKPPLTIQLHEDYDRVYSTEDEASPLESSIRLIVANRSTRPLVGEDADWGEDHPSLKLWFVLDEPPGYGALTNVTRAKDIRISLDGRASERWEVLHARDVPAPGPAGDGSEKTRRVEPLLYWEVRPKATNHDVLGGGEAIAINISGIVTDLPVEGSSESTPLYLQASGFPSHNDGLLTCRILREAGPEITSFAADPAAPPLGHGSYTTTLTWTTSDSGDVKISGDGERYFGSGTAKREVSPGEEIELTAYAKGSDSAFVRRRLKILSATWSSILFPFGGTAMVAPDEETVVLLEAAGAGPLARVAIVDVSAGQGQTLELEPIVHPEHAAAVADLEGERAKAIAANDAELEAAKVRTLADLRELLAELGYEGMDVGGGMPPPARIDWSRPEAEYQVAAARAFATTQRLTAGADVTIGRQTQDHARNRERIEESFRNRRAELESHLVAVAECAAPAVQGRTTWVVVRCHAGTPEESAAVVAVDVEAGSATLLRGDLAAASSSPAAEWGLVKAPDEAALYVSSGDYLHVVPLRDGQGAAAAGSRPWPRDWVDSLGPLRVGGCSSDGTKVYVHGPRGLLIADVTVGLAEIARWSVEEIDSSYALPTPIAVSSDRSRIFAAVESGSGSRLLAFDLDPASLEPQVVAKVDLSSKVLALDLRAGGDKLFVALDVTPPVVRIVDTETLAGGDVRWADDNYRARGFAPSRVAGNVFYSTAGGDVTRTEIAGL